MGSWVCIYLQYNQVLYINYAKFVGHWTSIAEHYVFMKKTWKYNNVINKIKYLSTDLKWNGTLLKNENSILEKGM